MTSSSRPATTAGTPSAGPTPRAPASISVRRGAGVNGSDRATLVWPDGAVRNTWLRVTVLDTSDTGLSSPDVFAFASLPGSTAAPAIAGSGNVAVPDTGLGVTWRDLLLTRRGLGRRRRVDLSSDLDHNRDRRVDAARPAGRPTKPDFSSGTRAVAGAAARVLREPHGGRRRRRFRSAFRLADRGEGQLDRPAARAPTSCSSGAASGTSSCSSRPVVRPKIALCSALTAPD